MTDTGSRPWVMTNLLLAAGRPVWIHSSGAVSATPTAGSVRIDPAPRCTFPARRVGSLHAVRVLVEAHAGRLMAHRPAWAGVIGAALRLIGRGLWWLERLSDEPWGAAADEREAA